MKFITDFDLQQRVRLGSSEEPEPAESTTKKRPTKAKRKARRKAQRVARRINRR